MGSFYKKRQADIQTVVSYVIVSYMINNDLSHGCQICNGLINSNNIKSAGLKHYKNLRSNKNSPIKLELELSHQCNLKCIMCYQSKEVKSNAEIYDSNFIKQVSEFLPYLKSCLFLGGEPFLIEIYYQLLRIINKTNPNCLNYIQTNGTIWNEKIKSLIEQGNFQISVSLDAVDEQLYKNIRTNSTFSNVLENIHHFNNYMKSKNGKLNIAVCPMKNNVSNIPEIIRFASKIDADIYFHTVYTPPDLALTNYPKNDLLKILELYKDFIGNFISITYQNKNSFLILINCLSPSVKLRNFYSFAHD